VLHPFLMKGGQVESGHCWRRGRDFPPSLREKKKKKGEDGDSGGRKKKASVLEEWGRKPQKSNGPHPERRGKGRDVQEGKRLLWHGWGVLQRESGMTWPIEKNVQFTTETYSWQERSEGRESLKNAAP